MSQKVPLEYYEYLTKGIPHNVVPFYVYSNCFLTSLPFAEDVFQGKLPALHANHRPGPQRPTETQHHRIRTGGGWLLLHSVKTVLIFILSL